MTKQEKETQVQIALGTYLPIAWKKYAKMRWKAECVNNRITRKYGGTAQMRSTKVYRMQLTYAKAVLDAEQFYVDAVISVYGGAVNINWKTGEVSPVL